MSEQLIRQIESAIRAGRVVPVGDVTIRYCKGGQEFRDQDQHFRAHVSGVFLRMKVFEGRYSTLGTPTGTTWGYYALLDDLDVALKAPLDRLTAQERATLATGLAFTAGLSSLRAEDARPRNFASPVGEPDCELAPAER